jgi:methyltransferase (TIGR00027 family)
MTARKVAGDFLWRAADPDVARLAPAGSVEATYKVMETAGILKPWMVRLIKAPWYQKVGNALEKPILEGQTLHLVLRKRFLDDEVRAAIADGATQVLVVGGGYDTLCLRLSAEFPEVTFLEIDHPPTHKVKAAAIAEMGEQGPNLHLEGVDLSERSLSEFLQQMPAWSSDAFSVVIAEGVLMYLSEEDVVAFLAAARSNSARGSRVLVTYVFEGAFGRKHLGWLGGALTLFLKLVGEPFDWGVQKDGIEPFLRAHGFRILGDDTRFDLKERYLDPAGMEERVVARLERVVAAEATETSAT